MQEDRGRKETGEGAGAGMHTVEEFLTYLVTGEDFPEEAILRDTFERIVQEDPEGAAGYAALAADAGASPKRLILGDPGTDRKLTAAKELAFVLLATDDPVRVLAGDASFDRLAAALGGTVILPGADPDLRINPMDFDISGEDRNAEEIRKLNELEAFLEEIEKGRPERAGTSSAAGGIDAAVGRLLSRYRRRLEQENAGLLPVRRKTAAPDADFAPTLDGLVREMQRWKDDKAEEVSTLIRPYLGTFGGRTAGVPKDARFVVYSLEQVTDETQRSLWRIALLGELWNESARHAGKSLCTWAVIDEADRYFDTEAGARFMMSCFTDFRKNSCVAVWIAEHFHKLALPDFFGRSGREMAFAAMGFDTRMEVFRERGEDDRAMQAFLGRNELPAFSTGDLADGQSYTVSLTDDWSVHKNF